MALCEGSKCAKSCAGPRARGQKRPRGLHRLNWQQAPLTIWLGLHASCITGAGGFVASIHTRLSQAQHPAPAAGAFGLHRSRRRARQPDKANNGYCVGTGRGCRACRMVAAVEGSQAEEAEQPSGPPKINVVLTHTTADFDSLAAAVGLARLWESEEGLEGECFVCMPRGTNPVVKQFLALHKNLLPIKKLKEIPPEQVRRLGLVDAQTKDRVGPATTLVDAAEEVHVYDHHVAKFSDMVPTKLVIEKVGSVTTIIAELLLDRQVGLSDAEATLLALGIHSDTGSLTYDGATPRDARALAWLMEQGASQPAIAEYGQATMSPELQQTLSDAFLNLNKTVYNGVTVSHVVLDTETYVNGMARVAQNLLETTNSDVLLLGSTFAQRKDREHNHMTIIGRARARVSTINLNKLLTPYGGGGHPKAASTSLRLDDAIGQNRTSHQIMEELINTLCRDHIRATDTAAEIMTAPVLTCKLDHTIKQAAQELNMYNIRGMPVLNAQKEVVGILTSAEVEKAVKANKTLTHVSAWLGPMPASVDISQPVQEIENIIIENDAPRVLVLEKGKLVGLITRTDILRQHDYYNSLHYNNKAFSQLADTPSRRSMWALRKYLKQWDPE